MLCHDGGADPARLASAIWDYNHSLAYVTEVLADAASLGLGSPGALGDRAAEALRFAMAQIGTPYVWGGEQAGVGFDCSGLAQAAYAEAGVKLPRVAQDQFDAGPHVVPGVPLAPGDLVFFGTDPTNVTHVGLVLDPSGLMVDAPHSGANVRIETFPTVLGAAWGDEIYVGATRPA
jgi:cell wall-associated NlpC family hydrolase